MNGLLCLIMTVDQKRQIINISHRILIKYNFTLTPSDIINGVMSEGMMLDEVYFRLTAK